MNSSRNLLILFFLLFSQFSITSNDKLVKIQRKCSTFSLHKYFSCFIWETNLKLQIQFPLSAQQCLRFSFTIFNIEELFSVGFAFFWNELKLSFSSSSLSTNILCLILPSPPTQLSIRLTVWFPELKRKLSTQHGTTFELETVNFFFLEKLFLILI